MSETRAFLPLGSTIQWGARTLTVQAVGYSGGERSYWLTDAGGGISMLPADVVEPRAKPAPC